MENDLLPVEDYQRQFVIAAVGFLGRSRVRDALDMYTPLAFIHLDRAQRRAFLRSLAAECISAARYERGNCYAADPKVP